MNKLARWYDLDVFYLNEQTKNIHLSGMMTRYKEVSELFHYFEKISTARFIIKGRTVTVKLFKINSRECTTIPSCNQIKRQRTKLTVGCRIVLP